MLMFLSVGTEIQMRVIHRAGMERGDLVGFLIGGDVGLAGVMVVQNLDEFAG